MIIRSKTEIQCDDCKDIITPEQMKSDKVRVYKTKIGACLCECCYDDYIEKSYPSDDEE
jgi:hypothetical protein